MVAEPKTVLVMYNQVEKDVYEDLRSIDPATLNFTPNYSIHVATVQEEYDAIVEALRKEGFNARGVNLRDDLSMLLKLITEDPPDVVFNLVEFFSNDTAHESSVAGLFDLCRIRYTGAPPFCLSLCRHKGLTKQILLQNGLATPHFRILQQPVIERRHGLRYPLIVKPSRQDGSAGVEAASVVRDYAQLRRQLEATHGRFGPPILVEEFIDGKELHVSVLGNTPPMVLPVLEYDFSELQDDHPPVITYDVKWNPLAVAYHRVHARCPAQIDAEIENLVKEQCLAAYAATYCRDYARLDLRLGSDGVPYILEVNPNPDLTEGVSFMQSAEKAGFGFSETLHRIVSFALERSVGS